VKPKEREAGEQTLAKKISTMTTGEKTKLALTGDKASRVILIREKNKQIHFFVLQNPRITEDEILQIAHSTDTTGEILSKIVSNREWIRRYRILHAVTCNPKTPIHLAAKLLDHLRERDLRLIAKSKNISTSVAAQARRILYQRGKI